MMYTDRKRRRDQDDDSQPKKVARRRVGDHETRNGLSAPLFYFQRHADSQKHNESSLPDATVSAFGPKSPLNGQVSAFSNNGFGSAKKSPTSFTYLPFEDYRKAEALRLLFTKRGLRYRQPSRSTELLSENSLAPYIAQWEESLSHWSAILCGDPSRKENLHNIDDDQSAEKNPFGKIRFQPDNKWSNAPNPSLQDNASSLPSVSQNINPNIERTCTQPIKPPFKSTIAGWGPWAGLRQMVRTEIKKQLDIFTRHQVEANDSFVDTLQDFCFRSDSSSSDEKRSTILNRRRPKAKIWSSDGYLDTLTDIPEMVPVRQLPDGTIEYVEEASGTTADTTELTSRA